jgi:uncharacterized protein YceK
MRKILLAMALPLALSGCFSYTEATPARETVIVPQGTTAVVPAPSTVVCADGSRPPC